MILVQAVWMPAAAEVLLTLPWEAADSLILAEAVWMPVVEAPVMILAPAAEPACGL